MKQNIDNSQLTNPDYVINKELHLQSPTGAYTRTSIAFCNTSRTHGLLVAPVKEFENKPHVLLSSLDEVFEQDGCSFKLGFHQFPGTYYPEGINFIQNVSLTPHPKIVYCMGALKLVKELYLDPKNDVLQIRYSLTEACKPMTLKLFPYLAFRQADKLCQANGNTNFSFRNIENGIKMKLYFGYPYLFMQMTKEAQFVFSPDWHYDFSYNDDRLFGDEWLEDLYMPGYIETTLSEGQRMLITISLRELSNDELTRRLRHFGMRQKPKRKLKSTTKQKVKEGLKTKNPV